MASGEMTDEAFRGFLTETLGAASRVSRDGAVHFICMDWRHMEDVAAVGRTIYGDLLNLCFWNKSNAGVGSLYRSKHELVFVYKVGSAPHFNAVELGRHRRNRTNVWDYASVNSLAGSRREDLALHPTVKPTALVADAIQDVTRRAELVLDIFLEVTVEEALQHRTYQDAIAGNRAARREVLKMIAKREKWLAAKAPKQHHNVEMLLEHAKPANANEALLLLGVAERDTRDYGPNDQYERLLLRPWAVQVALSRPGRRRLSAKDVSEIRRSTRDPQTLRWPPRTLDEQGD
jgi:hypothetical protein